MMGEASEVPAFGQTDQGEDGGHSRQGAGVGSRPAPSGEHEPAPRAHRAASPAAAAARVRSERSRGPARRAGPATRCPGAQARRTPPTSRLFTFTANQLASAQATWTKASWDKTRTASVSGIAQGRLHTTPPGGLPVPAALDFRGALV